MKKILFLFSSLFVAGSLVACGGGSSSNAPADSTKEDSGHTTDKSDGIDEVTIALGTAAPDNDESLTTNL